MAKAEGTMPLDGEIKRFYISGMEFTEIKCPGCGGKMSCELDDSYLSYPTAGEEVEISFFCPNCSTDDKEALFVLPCLLEPIRVTIQYDPAKLRKESV